MHLPERLRATSEIALCNISHELKARKIKFPKQYKGLSPAIDNNTIIWQGIDSQTGVAMGIKQIQPKSAKSPNTAKNAKAAKLKSCQMD